MADKVLLKVDNLKVEYNTDKGIVHAVNGISFELNEGENLGLVGETGAGKTTAALSILRLLPKNIGFIREGSITFNGKDIVKLPESGIRDIRGESISMIFQDPMTSLNPIMTVGQQIAEVLVLHKKFNKNQIDERVNEILNLVGLPVSRKKDYPHQFSGGMKQRVVIAIALACDPKLLIADEPTTALDVTIQAQVLEMMNNLKASLNTSMILITHDLGIVVKMCEKVGIMYAGEIIEYGSIFDIYDKDKPHHPYTIGLFGSIPSLEEKVERLSPIEGLVPEPISLPNGCKFHPRCSHCTDICKTKEPVMKTCGSHKIMCHLY